MAPRFVKTITADELQPGQMRAVQVEGRALLLANVDGRVFAVDDMCTHEDAALSRGALHGNCVSCPLHGSRFDLATGQALEEPATEPLQTYEVRVEKRDIWIGLPG